MDKRKLRAIREQLLSMYNYLSDDVKNFNKDYLTYNANQMTDEDMENALQNLCDGLEYTAQECRSLIKNSNM